LSLAVYFAHNSTISSSKQLVELLLKTRDAQAIDVSSAYKRTQAIRRESSALLWFRKDTSKIECGQRIRNLGCGLASNVQKTRTRILQLACKHQLVFWRHAKNTSDRACSSNWIDNDSWIGIHGARRHRQSQLQSVAVKN
jgi:hypothetical protein